MYLSIRFLPADILDTVHVCVGRSVASLHSNSSMSSDGAHAMVSNFTFACTPVTECQVYEVTECQEYEVTECLECEHHI